MLRSFRVQDFQNLLRLYKSISGRKYDLYQRSLNLFHSHDPKQLERQINTLYSQMQSFRYRSYPLLLSSTSENNIDDDKESSVMMNQQHYSHSHVKMGALPQWGVRAEVRFKN